MNIVIVHGGSSTEQAVSTHNAHCVEASLRRLGHQTEMLFYNTEMIGRLLHARWDLVFVCVQGKGHGDGTLQALLEFLGLPYTGSRAAAAAIINDKIICKELFAQAGIPTPPWAVLRGADYRAGRLSFFRSRPGFPLVAKAPSQGGSFGIELIKTEKDIPLIEKVFAYDDPILLERFVPGTFATVALLEREGALEAFPPATKVSLEAGQAKELVLVDPGRYRFAPCPFAPALLETLRETAKKVFYAARARGYARVDFMVDRENNPWVLEINAVPGLKEESLYPYCASLGGLDFDQVVDAILRDALRVA